MTDSYNQYKQTNIRKMTRLKKIAKEYNVSIRTIIDYLKKNGYQVDSNPNTKIDEEQYNLVHTEFHGKLKQTEPEKLVPTPPPENKTMDSESEIQSIVQKDIKHDSKAETMELPEFSLNRTDREQTSHIQHINTKHDFNIKIVGKIDLDAIKLITHHNESMRKTTFLEKDEDSAVKRSQSITKTVTEKQNIYVPFSSLIFKNNKIVLNYSGKDYFHDFQKGTYCKYLISKNKEILSSEGWEKYGKFKISVQLEDNNGLLTFNFVNFNLISFIVEMCEEVRNTINLQIMTTEKAYNELQEFVRNTIESIQPTSFEGEQLFNIQKSSLGIDNIEFHDGFYLIWLLKNGERDTSITPLRVDDTCSYTSLRLVHKYLSDNFPHEIQIVYTEKNIIELTKPYLLSDYIRVLHDNIDIRGEWWNELQNERKPSLKNCRQITDTELRKKVALKNGYLDNLSSLQNSKKLIPVYEINHGKQEDAFLFSIDMPNNNCAVIFENISFAATATEIFITKNEKYESCIELVFDYFTDYTINAKRESLRRKIYSPNKFNADNHFVINHYDLEQWMSTLFKIIERSPINADIEFVSGLNVPADSIERTVSTPKICTKNIHNKLIRHLYYKLSNEYGAANVGTEIRVGSKRIDTVVKLADCYDIYEIKTTTDPFSCVTLALGQLCQYAYLFCRDKIRRLIIVGPSKASKEVDDYLSWFRETYSLQVYYMHLHI